MYYCLTTPAPTAHSESMSQIFHSFKRSCGAKFCSAKDAPDPAFALLVCANFAHVFKLGFGIPQCLL